MPHYQVLVLPDDLARSVWGPEFPPSRDVYSTVEAVLRGGRRYVVQIANNYLYHVKGATEIPFAIEDLVEFRPTSEVIPITEYRNKLSRLIEQGVIRGDDSDAVGSYPSYSK